MGTQTTFPLPLSSFTDLDPRSNSKQLINCFAETNDADSFADTKNPKNSIPAKLRRMYGIMPFSGFNDGSNMPVRGMHQMGGFQYVLIGPTLYSVQQAAGFSAVLTAVGTGIPGNSFVRMVDNGECMVILIPGTALGWVFTTTLGLQPMTVATQPTYSFFLNFGAIDVWFVDSYFVFLALNGTTFYNDDGRLVSGTGEITFTTAAFFTREFGTDPFVGGAVDHREVILFGTLTTEGYVNAGNPAGSPFSSAPDSYMEIGAHPLCAYAIALQDQSVIWVANDKTVRRRNGQTPVIISNSGIEDILQAVNLTGCYAICPTIAGCPMWILIIPNAYGPGQGRSIAYNCRLQKFFDLESYDAANNVNSWRVLCYYNGFGLQLVGDPYSSQVGILSQNTFTEYGNPQPCSFTTQDVYDSHSRIAHRRIEVVCTMGATLTPAYAPIIDIMASDDGGRTFGNFVDTVNLGVEGDYTQRAQAFNLGQSRDRVYMIRVTDATTLFTVDIQLTVEKGAP